MHASCRTGVLIEPLGEPIKNPSRRLRFVIGAPGGIRTPDQVVRSHLLYPAELRVRDFTRYLVLITS